MTQIAAVLNEIHKQAEVSADHAASLLCKAGDPLLKQELTERHMEFSNFASDAEKRLRSIGYRTADGPSFVRLTAKAGLQVSSMLDSSPSQLATLMIRSCFDAEENHPCFALDGNLIQGICVRRRMGLHG